MRSAVYCIIKQYNDMVMILYMKLLNVFFFVSGTLYNNNNNNISHSVVDGTKTIAENANKLPESGLSGGIL